MSEKLYGGALEVKGAGAFWVNFGNICAEGIDKNTIPL